MSNVIRLNAPVRGQGGADPRAAMIDAFAHHRRGPEDVFWLKENAELLNILECTGARLDPAALAPHHDFYERIEAYLTFFPQYYRFVLSICLDLEDLGLAGAKSEALARYAVREGLAEAELSDLQRLEARRLMRRRGLDPLAWDTGLEARVRRFLGRPATFAVPNRKVGYELTHLVFYLSDYGRRDPELSRKALTSLEYAGILAYLDLDADILAEICIAMRYSGVVPPGIWERWLARETRGFRVETGATGALPDDYHAFLVCNWGIAAAGGDAFAQSVPPGRMTFRRPLRPPSPLREISECLYRMQDARSADWEVMRPRIEGVICERSAAVLNEARASCESFAGFFASFARAAVTVGPRADAVLGTSCDG
ncbi:MAG: hypothetical protein KDK29_08805 [Sedimentitalea sp.]|nr:hypothetical protein [Sedimentitalea sp.]